MPSHEETPSPVPGESGASSKTSEPNPTGGTRNRRFTSGDYQAILDEAERLRNLGLKLITIIPNELPAHRYPSKNDPSKPAFCGKNPSRWKTNGEPMLLSHRQPLTANELWDAVSRARRLGRPIGLAIVPSTQTVVVDFDAKNYRNDPAALEADYRRLVAQYPALERTRTERTQSGGIHVFLRVADGMGSWQKSKGSHHCNFTTTADGPHRGEVLSGTRICVTAPTIATQGRYSLLEGTEDFAYTLVEVANLAAVGITPICASKQKPEAKPGITLHDYKPATSLMVGSDGEIVPPHLQDLLRSKAQEVLKGGRPYGDDRSSNLTGFLRELYGCVNFIEGEGLPYVGTVEQLKAAAVEALGIHDKADRVDDTIDSSACTWGSDREASLSRYRNAASGSLQASAALVPPPGGTPDPARSSVDKTFQDLLAEALQAVRDGDEDVEMAARAAIMGRFKRTDSQVTAALFRLLTNEEGQGPKKQPRRGLDLSRCQELTWLVEDFFPDFDEAMVYGNAGAGKTTAALHAAFAVIDGDSFLGSPPPSRTGRVLYIASDSGAAPLKKDLQAAKLLNHPAIADGRFVVWAHDAGQGQTAWACTLGGCLEILDLVKDGHFALVILDSVKAITSRADLNYMDNSTVAALLTFFKEVICRHVAVVWINHDGTQNGAHAGAKAWREIPSAVHRIEKPEVDNDKIPEEFRNPSRVKPEDRTWHRVKARHGSTEPFAFCFDKQSGSLRTTEGGKNAREAILFLLIQQAQRGRQTVSLDELVKGAGDQWGISSKTIKNKLTELKEQHPPEVCSRRRGFYSLAPRLLEKARPLIASGLGRDSITHTTARERVYGDPDHSPNTESRDKPPQTEVQTEIPRDNDRDHPDPRHKAGSQGESPANARKLLGATLPPLPTPRPEQPSPPPPSRANQGGRTPICVDGEHGWLLASVMPKGTGQATRVVCINPRGKSALVERCRITEVAA